MSNLAILWTVFSAAAGTLLFGAAIVIRHEVRYHHQGSTSQEIVAAVLGCICFVAAALICILA